MDGRRSAALEATGSPPDPAGCSSPAAPVSSTALSPAENGSVVTIGRRGHRGRDPRPTQARAVRFVAGLGIRGGGRRQAGADGLLLLPPYLVTLDRRRAWSRYVGGRRRDRAASDLSTSAATPCWTPEPRPRMRPSAGVRHQGRPRRSRRHAAHGHRERTRGSRAARTSVLQRLPTAEMPVPAYGPSAWTSTPPPYFCFAPEIAPRLPPGGTDRRRATAVQRLLAEFYRPLVDPARQVPDTRSL